MQVDQIPSGYKLTEVGIIPSDWDIVKLRDIADVRDGTHDSPKYYNQGIMFITSKNIINGRLDLQDVTYISEQDATYINKRSMVNKGDILMSMIGTIGNSVLIKDEPDFCIKNVALIKPNKNINNFYLVQFLNSSVFKNILINNLDGGIQKFISLSKLRKLSFPLPPIEEQKRIAQVLSDIDELIRSLDELIIKKRNIKQGTMQLLLTGKQRLPGYSGEWEVKKLGEIVQNNKIPSGIYKEKEYYGMGTKIVKISDVFNNDYYIPEFAQRVELNSAELSNYTLEVGDIIIALASVKLEGVGKVMFVEKLDEITVFDHNVALIRPKNNVYNRYIFYSLKSNTIRKFIASKATQVGTTFLKTSTILEFTLLLPPTIEEQKAIARILSDMDEEIEVLEQKRNKYQDIKKGMMQELLTGKTRLV